MSRTTTMRATESTRWCMILVALAMGMVSLVDLAWGAQTEPALTCLESASSQQIAYGQHTEGDDCIIDGSSDADYYYFDGNEGDLARIMVASRTPGYDPHIEVRAAPGGGPFREPFFTTSCSGNDGFGRGIICRISRDEVLPWTGRYMIILTDSGSNEIGEYGIQIERLLPPPAAVRLTHGALEQDDVDPKTDHDFFSFRASEDELVRFNLRTHSTGLDPRVEIRSPDGTLIEDTYCSGNDGFGRGITCSLSLDLTLPSTGEYDVSISDAGNNETGQYSVQIERIFPGPPLSHLGCDDPREDATDADTDVDFFGIRGAAGDRVRVSLRTTSTGFDPRIELRDSTGAVLHDGYCSGNDGFGRGIHCTNSFEIELTNSSSHILTVSDQGTNESGSYLLQVERILPSCPAASVELDVPVEGATAPVTDLKFYTFDASPGTQMRLNLRSRSTGFDPRVEIWDPDGELIEDRYCSGNDGFGRGIHCSLIFDELALAGTYTAAVSDAGLDESGSYVFQLEQLVPAIDPVPVVCETPLQTVIDPTTDMDFLSFRGVAGRSVRIQMFSRTGGLDPSLEIWGPSGAKIGDRTWCNGNDGFGRPIQCSTSLDLQVEEGTYTLALSDVGIDEGGTIEVNYRYVDGPCPADDCGNGQIDPGEQCDPSMIGSACCDGECRFRQAGTTCRDAAGMCDVAEVCTGVSPVCPADEKSTDVCRSAAGVCDVLEVCDGVSNDCPVDGFRPDGFECRSSVDPLCDPDESCTGDDPFCPVDVVVEPCGCEEEAAVVLDCQEQVTAGATFDFPVGFDVGERRLGAYSIVVTWDPAVLEVLACQPGGSVEFGAPENCVIDNEIGQARINDRFAGAEGPSDVVEITVLSIRAVGEVDDVSPIDVEVRSLFDSNVAPIEACDASCSIEIPNGICGDVNDDGGVDIGDSLVIAQYDVGLRTCGVAPFSRSDMCDVNRDEHCDIGDALFTAHCDVGLRECSMSCRPWVCPGAQAAAGTVPVAPRDAKPVGLAFAAPKMAGLAAGDLVSGEVVFQLGDQALGAYSVTFECDSADFEIVEIAGGSAREFAGRPTVAFDSCRATIAAFQAESRDGPTGRVSVAEVTLRARRAVSGESLMEIFSSSLFDTDGRVLDVERPTTADEVRPLVRRSIRAPGQPTLGRRSTGGLNRLGAIRR